jgi:hypothetical protein
MHKSCWVIGASPSCHKQTTFSGAKATVGDPFQASIRRSRFSLSRASREDRGHFSDCRIEFGVGSATVKVAPGERKASTSSKPLSLTATMTTEHDFGLHCVIRDAVQLCKLSAHKLARRRTEIEAVGSNMDRQVSHGM